jgi:hypothetical protein
VQQQIALSKIRIDTGEAENLSTCINDDLKIAGNIFGHTIPKVLAILEDVVKLYQSAHQIPGKIDYSKLRSIFEHYHLPAGLAGLEEMGIPIQTLQRLAAQTTFPEDLDVDAMAEYLRSNPQLWSTVSAVDRAFIIRALLV